MDEAFGYRFLGEFEIIVTRSVMTERAERPFIQALEGAVSSLGALEAESPYPCGAPNVNGGPASLS